jgi:aminopeptidase N
MEYPMATLLIGPSLGTVFHELMHTWYQMILGTNESINAWMDEGFADFSSAHVAAFYRDNFTRIKYKNNPAYIRSLDSAAALLPLVISGSYRSYYNLAKSDYQEPLTTHSDHFETNLGYSVSSYSKGAVFIEQLGYVVGAEMRDKILKEYYNQWRFKHPNTNDLIRIAEDMSGIKLDWYKEYWCNTIKTIDYGIDSLWEEGGVSKIRLIRKGKVPMPIDFRLTFKDSTTEMHYIPLNLMYGSKSTENVSEPREEHTAWKWTHPTYIVEFKRRLSDLKRAEIDPSKRMADIDLRSNLLQLNW